MSALPVSIIEKEVNLKLNLGCGVGKIEGFINVDIDETLKPDKVFDIRGAFPLEDNSCSQVVMYHTLEHLEKTFWQGLFIEVSRVLEIGGKFWLTFPEYPVVWKYWESNHRGMREFWERCMFGRGTTLHDRHISVTARGEVEKFLFRSGFLIEISQVEPQEDHNSLIMASNRKPFLYSEVLKDSVWGKRDEFTRTQN